MLVPGGAAARAGSALRPGDVIMQVDGADVFGVSTQACIILYYIMLCYMI
jgi:C-terminal processing protease CtpA/Prc